MTKFEVSCKVWFLINSIIDHVDRFLVSLELRRKKMMILPHLLTRIRLRHLIQRQTLTYLIIIHIRLVSKGLLVVRHIRLSRLLYRTKRRQVRVYARLVMDLADLLLLVLDTIYSIPFSHASIQTIFSPLNTIMRVLLWLRLPRLLLLLILKFL